MIVRVRSPCCPERLSLSSRQDVVGHGTHHQRLYVSGQCRSPLIESGTTAIGLDGVPAYRSRNVTEILTIILKIAPYVVVVGLILIWSSETRPDP
ncbi:hypothetical protein TNCV_4830241 [Trichonephila clavipes]|nr:hypothetical protein TNCV_4830241 [Trichonephila clavipes]